MLALPFEYSHPASDKRDPMNVMLPRHQIGYTSGGKEQANQCTEKRILPSVSPRSWKGWQKFLALPTEKRFWAIKGSAPSAGASVGGAMRADLVFILIQGLDLESSPLGPIVF